MAKSYRKIIRPTDPRINIALPLLLYSGLKLQASNNARRLSDEIVARLIATLKQSERWDKQMIQLINNKVWLYDN